MKLQAVIFDVDGTLVDSNEFHVEAWRAAFRRYGKELSAEAVHAQLGKGADQLVPVFCSKAEVRRFGKALERHRAEHFLREYLPQVRPFPGVRALFERLRADGLRIVLATSAKKKELARHLKNLGVAELVDGATSANDVARSKPCPDLFQAALSLAQAAPAQALAVGDSPFDAQAAAKLGLRTVAVLTGGFSPQVLRQAGAMAVYRDVADLLHRYEDSPLGAAARSESRPA